MPGTTQKADLTRRKSNVNPLSIKLSRIEKADCSAPLPVREYHTVRVRDADSGRSVQLVFSETHVVGEGSFGIVTCAQLYRNNEHERGVVALKRTRQDKRFKCREMQIISAVLHPNIVKLRYYWYEADEQSDDLFLNLMFEYLVRPFPCPRSYIGDVEDQLTITLHGGKAGDALPSVPLVRQAQAVLPGHPHQAVHLSSKYLVTLL